MRTSSITYMYFYKIAGLAPSIFAVISGILIVVNSDQVLLNSDNIAISFLFAGLASVFFLFWYKIGRKMTYVEADENNITVHNGKTTKSFSWYQISKIKKIIITIPVSYRIYIKNDSDSYIFCSTPLLPAPFHIFDTTPIGKLLKAKMKEINKK